MLDIGLALLLGLARESPGLQLASAGLARGGLSIPEWAVVGTLALLTLALAAGLADRVLDPPTSVGEVYWEFR